MQDNIPLINQWIKYFFENDNFQIINFNIFILVRTTSMKTTVYTTFPYLKVAFFEKMISEHET